VPYTGAKFKSVEDRQEQAAELIIMLKRSYPDKFVNEIVGGYYLADKKKLLNEDGTTLEMFRMVDYRQASDITQGFNRYFAKAFEHKARNQQMFEEDNEPEPETTEQINERYEAELPNAVEIVKSGKRYDKAGIDIGLYNYLVSVGKINLENLNWNQELKMAENQYRGLLQKERLGACNFGRSITITNLLQTIQPKDIAVVNRAKSNVLNNYLKSISENKALNHDEQNYFEK